MSTTIEGQAPLSTATDTAAQRVAWIDYAKGILILLVVAGHVLGGLADAGVLRRDGLPTIFEAIVYSFHMPAFFFLSGMFAARSAAKGDRSFLTDKVRVILYPYVVWSLLQGGINSLLSSFTNASTSFSSVLLSIPFQPGAQFWFLYVLFLNLILFLVLFRLKLNPPTLFAVAVGLFATQPLLAQLSWGVPVMVARFFLFFAAGHCFGPSLLRSLPAMPTFRLLGTAALLFVLLLVTAPFLSYKLLLAAPLLAFLGCGGTIALSAWLNRRRDLPFLVYLGNRSLPIFLAHVLGTAGARIVLLKIFHIEDGLIHIFAGIACGLALPLFLDHIARRVGFHYLFTLRPEK